MWTCTTCGKVFWLRNVTIGFFHDTHFCQVIWQIFIQGRAKKLPQVGIEPRTCHSNALLTVLGRLCWAGDFWSFVSNFTCWTLIISGISRAWLYKGLNDSQRLQNSDLAQLLEHLSADLDVVGSIPTGCYFWWNLFGSSLYGDLSDNLTETHIMKNWNIKIWNFILTFSLLVSLYIFRPVSKSSDRYTTCNICLDQFQITQDVRSPSLTRLHSNHLSTPTHEPSNSQFFQSHHRNQSTTSLRSRASNGILGLLPCDHVYHFACIWEWLLFKNVCPTCKAVTGLQDIKTISESAFVEYYDNYCIQSKKLKLPRVKIEDFRQRFHSDPRYPQNDPFQMRVRAHTTDSSVTRDRMLKRMRGRSDSSTRNSIRRIFVPDVCTNSQGLNRRVEINALPITRIENLRELSPIRNSLLTLYPDVVQNDEYRLRSRSNVSDLSVLYI